MNKLLVGSLILFGFVLSGCSLDLGIPQSYVCEPISVSVVPGADESDSPGEVIFGDTCQDPVAFLGSHPHRYVTVDETPPGVHLIIDGTGVFRLSVAKNAPLHVDAEIAYSTVLEFRDLKQILLDEVFLGYGKVLVTVESPVTATADPPSVPVGGPSQLSVSTDPRSFEGGLSYSWEPTTGLSDPTAPDPLATPEESTTYTVTVSGMVTVKEPGRAPEIVPIERTASITVEVTPPPPTEFSLSVDVDGTGEGTVTDESTGIAIVCSDAGGDCGETYPAGTGVDLRATPESGSHFIGWAGCDTVDAGTGNCLVTMDADETVTATFDLLPPPPGDFTLSVLVNGTGDGQVTTLVGAGIDCTQAGGDCEETYPPGTEVGLEADAAPGSVFVGWQGPRAIDLAITRMEATPDPATAGGNLTYDIETANFGPDVASGVTLVTLATAFSPTTGLPEGPPPDVTLVSAPAGCTQPGGAGNPVECELGDIAAGDSAAVSIVVSPNSATLPLALGLPPLTNAAQVTNGTTDLNPSNDTAATHVAVLPASGCSGSALTTQVTMDADKTCTALFDLTPAPADFVLGVLVDGTGGGQVTTVVGTGIDCTEADGDCEETYAAGTEVRLQATPSFGSTFVSWAGCDSIDVEGGNLCVIQMDADRSVTATFDAVPVYTLTVNVLGEDGLGEVTSDPGDIDCVSENQGVCQDTFVSETLLVLTARINSFGFFDWSGDCAHAVRDQTEVFLFMDSDKTCTVTFSRF